MVMNSAPVRLTPEIEWSSHVARDATATQHEAVAVVFGIADCYGWISLNTSLLV